MTMRRYGSIGVAAAALITVVSGCSSSSKTPTVEDFAAGSCRQVAPAVLQIGHLVTVAHKQHEVSKQTQAAFTAAQTQIRRTATAPAGSQNLVTAIGFLRLRLDSHNYQPQLLSDVSAAQKDLERRCTVG